MGPSVNKEDGDGVLVHRARVSRSTSQASNCLAVVCRVEPMEVDLTPSPLRRVSSLFSCVLFPARSGPPASQRQ